MTDRDRLVEIRRVADLPLGTNETVTRQQRDELLGIAERLQEQVGQAHATFAAEIETLHKLVGCDKSETEK